MYSKAALSSIGLPHSGHSMGVSGSVSSQYRVQNVHEWNMGLRRLPRVPAPGSPQRP